MNQCSPEGRDGQNLPRSRRGRRLLAIVTSVLIIGMSLQLAVLVVRRTPYLVARYLGVEASLAGVSLSGANLRDVVLAGANLRGAHLQHANLRGANLSAWYFPDGPDNPNGPHQGICVALENGADLRDANLRGADLRGADLGRAKLSDADLTGANLAGANLDRTDLTGSDLRAADFRDANLVGANLTGARYDVLTHWPAGFHPPRHGAVLAK